MIGSEGFLASIMLETLLVNVCAKQFLLVKMPPFVKVRLDLNPPFSKSHDYC